MSPLFVSNRSEGAGVKAMGESAVVASPASIKAVEAVVRIVLKMSESPVVNASLNGPDVASCGITVVASVTSVEAGETAGSRRLEAVEGTVLTTSVSSAGEAVVAMSSSKLDEAPLTSSSIDVGDPCKADVGSETRVSTEAKADEREGKTDVKLAAAEESSVACCKGARVEVIDGSWEVRLSATDGTSEARSTTESRAEVADGKSDTASVVSSTIPVAGEGRADVKLAAAEDTSEARLSTVPRADETDGRSEVKLCAGSKAVVASELASPDAKVFTTGVTVSTGFEADGIADMSDARLCVGFNAVAASEANPDVRPFKTEVREEISLAAGPEADGMADKSEARLCADSNAVATFEAIPDVKLFAAEVREVTSLTIEAGLDAMAARSDVKLVAGSRTVVAIGATSEDKLPMGPESASAEVKLAASLLTEFKADVTDGVSDIRLAAELRTDETAGWI